MKKSSLIALLLSFTFCTVSYSRTVRLGINVQKDENSGFLQGFEYEYFQELAKYTGWNYTYFSGTDSEYIQALSDNKIDITVNYASCGHKGFSNKDIILNSNTPGLEKEFYAAQKQLAELNPNLIQNLKNKYFQDKKKYSDAENRIREWAKKHNSISVGYAEWLYPYSCKKNDSVRGIFGQYFSEILWQLDLETLSVKFVPYSTFDEAVEGLKNNQVDIIFPVYGNFNIMERNNINKTSNIADIPMSLVFMDKLKDGSNPDLIYLEDFSFYEGFVKEYLKDFKPKALSFDVLTDLKDLLKKQNTAVLIESPVVNLLAQESGGGVLNRVELAQRCPVAFAVRREDTELLNILDYGISRIEPAFSSNLLNEEVYKNKKYTFSDFISDNLLEVFSTLFLILLLLALGVIKYIEFIQSNERKLELSKKHLDEALKKAESASRAKSTFLNNMSHDIRTPMNAITGFTELMKNELNNPKVLASYIDKIQSSSEYLLSLINDVLDMARIESGKTHIDETFYDIKAESEYFYAVFEKDIRAKNITFNLDIDIKNPCIYADRLKLRQIWLNLTSNAIKYTGKNGHISIVNKEIPCDIEGFATYRAYIQDDGIGISKEFLPYVFDPFAREYNSTESKVMGTGLGLPIVKRIVELMGGNIQVESERNKGTKFTITLTHRIAQAKNEIKNDDKTPEIGKIDFSGKNVLLAEDNDLNAEIASTILSGIGFSVDLARNGLECCEKVLKAEEYFYDLILMDIQMPEMNGYEATKKIRSMENKLKANIPIIAMTANAFEEDKILSFESGVNDYIAKPVNVPELVNKIRKVVEG